DNEVNARACIEAAEDLNAPIILDVAFGAAVDIQFAGRMMVELARQAKVPVAINLDHGASFEQVIQCIQAGFTSVMIDRSSCPYEENVRDTKYVVDIAHKAGVSVEAELGHVGQADNYDVDRNAALTDPEVAKKFIEETGVDCLAVAVGTAHGAYPKGYVPYLDFERLAEIKRVTNNFPLVMHGSSGTKEEDLAKACRMGINKVNVNNDICQAIVEKVKNTDYEGNKAYFIMMSVSIAIKEKTKELIKLYGSDGKAWIPETKGLPRSKFPF
ncbi:MAG: class II fructose-bisphosphate aldolase, partial [Erysipelotrichaceae bacterium]|nr:class II fructose-bisphosphate aldolase [Erysipelotrichaceae bacterium]